MDLYFDLIETQVLQEIKEARKKLVAAVMLREGVSNEISKETVILQTRIKKILESSKRVNPVMDSHNDAA